MIFSFSFVGVSVLPAAANECRLPSQSLRNAPTWVPFESFLAAPAPCNLPRSGNSTMSSAQFKGNNTRGRELSVRSRRKGEKVGRIAFLAILGFQFFGHCGENIALSAPRQRLAVLSKLLQSLKNDFCLSTASKSRDQNPRPLPPGPRKRRHMASGSTAFAVIPNDFLVAEIPNGKNKTLTCALVAEQSRTSPASSGSSAALDCMADGSEKSSKGRERRKDKETEQSVAAMQQTVQSSLSK